MSTDDFTDIMSALKRTVNTSDRHIVVSPRTYELYLALGDDTGVSFDDGTWDTFDANCSIAPSDAVPDYQIWMERAR